MNHLKEKLKFVYYPFIVINVSFILAYTFVNWLLSIQLFPFTLREDVMNLWLPLGLPLIPLFIWLRPRLKILKPRSKMRDIGFGYIMFATMAIAAPTMVAQSYLESASGKLIPLSKISDISKQPAEKYYTLKEHYISKEDAGMEYTSDVSGRHNEDLNFLLYIACPIYDEGYAPTKIGPIKTDESKTKTQKSKQPLILLDGEEIDSVRMKKIPPDSIVSVNVLKDSAAIALYGDDGMNGVIIIDTKKNDEPPPAIIDVEVKFQLPAAWLCINYQKRLSNGLSTEEKNEQYRAFYKECLRKFDTTNLESFTYLARTGNDKTRDNYITAINKKRNILNKTPPEILEPKFEPFEARNGNKLIWVFGAFAIGAVIYFLLLLIPKFDEAGFKKFIDGKYEEKYDFKESLSLLIPKQNFYITPIIIDLNILIFLIMVFSGLGFLSFSAQDLLSWGGNYEPYTTNGEWWRLLTSTFLHAGAIHLFANMIGLLFVGVFLEPLLGKKKYAIIYLLSGIAASTASIWWHDATVSVGASGAIFGLYGFFLTMLLTKIYPADFKKSFLMSTLVFVGFNLAMGLAGGIDNAAHIGGIVFGFAAGFVLYPQIKKESQNTV